MIIVFFWGAWFQKVFFCIYNLYTKAFHWERDDKDMNFRHRQKHHIRPQRYMRVRNQDKVWRQHRTTHTSPKPLLPCVSPQKSQHTKAPHSPQYRQAACSNIWQCSRQSCYKVCRYHNQQVWQAYPTGVPNPRKGNQALPKPSLSSIPNSVDHTTIFSGEYHNSNSFPMTHQSFRCPGCLESVSPRDMLSLGTM